MRLESAAIGAGSPQIRVHRSHLRSDARIPAVRDRLIEIAQDIFPREEQTPEALGAYQKAEIEKRWPIIKEAGRSSVLVIMVRGPMRLPRRRFLHLAASAAALPAISRIARTQADPTRPVRLIMGFAAGGGYGVSQRLALPRRHRFHHWPAPPIADHP
jgi:hypothetical protein